MIFFAGKRYTIDITSGAKTTASLPIGSGQFVVEAEWLGNKKQWVVLTSNSQGGSRLYVLQENLAVVSSAAITKKSKNLAVSADEKFIATHTTHELIELRGMDLKLLTKKKWPKNIELLFFVD